MIRVLKLIFISYFFKKLLGFAFLIHGSYIAIKRWELLRYLEDVAIINDVWLNVVGKYSLNQGASPDEFAGNRLQTISAAMYGIRLHRFASRCAALVNRIDNNHFEKAHKKHVALIEKEYSRLKNK